MVRLDSRIFHRNQRISNGSDGLHRTTFQPSSLYCLHFRWLKWTWLSFRFYCTTGLHWTPGFVHWTPGFVHWNLVESIERDCLIKPCLCWFAWYKIGNDWETELSHIHMLCNDSIFFWPCRADFVSKDPSLVPKISHQYALELGSSSFLSNGVNHILFIYDPRHILLDVKTLTLDPQPKGKLSVCYPFCTVWNFDHTSWNSE